MYLMEIFRLAENLELPRLLGREIGDDNAVDTGVGSVAQEVASSLSEIEGPGNRQVVQAHGDLRQLAAIRRAQGGTASR